MKKKANMTAKPAYREIDPVNDPYWNDMRNHNYSKSFTDVSEFIQQHPRRIRYLKRSTNRITWVLAVLLPLLVFFSCKRKTYVEPQGATLSFIAKDSVRSNLDFVIRKYADKEWKSVLHTHAGIIHGTVSAPAESYNKLKAFAEELKKITGISELYLSAVSTTLKESRLSHLNYTIFNRHVDASGSSDEQLRTGIETKLQENGLHNLKVQLIKENGRKQVRFEPTGKKRDFSFNLTLPDGTHITAIAERW